MHYLIIFFLPYWLQYPRLWTTWPGDTNNHCCRKTCQGRNPSDGVQVSVSNLEASASFSVYMGYFYHWKLKWYILVIEWQWRSRFCYSIDWKSKISKWVGKGIEIGNHRALQSVVWRAAGNESFEDCQFFFKLKKNASVTKSVLLLISRLVDGPKFMVISYPLPPLEEHLMKPHSLSLRDHLCCSRHS